MVSNDSYSMISIGWMSDVLVQAFLIIRKKKVFLNAENILVIWLFSLELFLAQCF